MSEESRGPDQRPTLARFAQLAEILASLAVLVTLIFLVAEVRQNTETTRATSYDRSMEALNQWRLSVAADPDLSRMYEAHTRGEDGDLPVESGFRLQLVINTVWGIYENAYYVNQRGLLGASEWSRFERQICAQYDRNRVSNRWGGTFGSRTLLTEQFVTFVEGSCGP
jgi:hypothetical protein